MERMNGDFATTVAGVAPVVLLVATVEMNRTLPKMLVIIRAPFEQARIVASLYSDGAAPSREELLEARARVGALAPLMRRLAVVGYYVSAAVVCLALLAAEDFALQWLANPSRGPEPKVASFCKAALVWGFAWTLFSTAGLAAWAILRDVPRSAATGAEIRRFKREARQARRETASESGSTTQEGVQHAD